MSFFSSIANVAKKATKVAIAPVKYQVMAAKAGLKVAGKIASAPLNVVNKITPKPLKGFVNLATMPARLAISAPLSVANKSVSLASRVVSAATPGRATAAATPIRAAPPPAAPPPLQRMPAIPTVNKLIAAANPAAAVAVDSSDPYADPSPPMGPSDPTPQDSGGDDGSYAIAPRASDDFEAGPPDDSGAADYEGAEVEHEEGDPMALGDIDYAAAFAGIDDVDTSAQLYGLGDWKADLKNIGKTAAKGAAIAGGTVALNLAVNKLGGNAQGQLQAALNKPRPMPPATKIAIGAAVALPVLYLLTHKKTA